MGRTVIDDSLYLFGMVGRAFWRTPNAGLAELPAPTFFVVVWAVHFAPCVATASLYCPTVFFSVLDSILNIFARVLPSGHVVPIDFFYSLALSSKVVK
jgi:hypothetical protein